MKIKRFIAISAALLCFVGAVGCDEIDTGITVPEQTEPTAGEYFPRSSGNETVFIWTDEDTGVQYIIYREKLYSAGFGGITPRLNPDGSLYVIEPTTQDNIENGGEDNA